VARVHREILEALWEEARDQRAYSLGLREQVVATQQRSEAIRRRITLEREPAMRSADKALAKS
jgi:hypothetical protein